MEQSEVGRSPRPGRLAIIWRVGLMVLIAAIIVSLSRLKSAENRFDQTLTRSFGTSDLILRNAIAADDPVAVKKRLATIPKSEIRPNFVDTLAGWPTVKSLDAVLGLGWDPAGSRHDNSPLFLAISRGDLEVIRVLLRHGVDPNCRSADGEPALFEAVRHSSYKDLNSGATANLLLEKGANPNIEGIARAVIDDRDVVFAATASKSPRALPSGLAAKMPGAGAGRPVVSPVHGEFARVDIGPLDQKTRALTIAVGSLNLGAIRALLEHGADPNWASRSGVRPLVLATLTNESKLMPKALALLLEHGAKVDALGLVNTTMKVKRKTVVVEHIMATALYVAAQHGDLESAKVLLSHGANPKAVASNHKRPIDVATGDVAALFTQPK